MPSIARMRALGWGNPDSPTFRSDRISNLRVRGIVLPVNRDPNIQYLFRVLAISLDGMGAKLAARRDDWGYANRPIRGASAKSNHAWGLAVDLDALENLLGTSRTSFPVPRAQALVKRLGMTKPNGERVGIHWGLNYKGRKDPMHFEFVGSPADAAAIVRRLRTRKSLKALAATLLVPAAFFASNGLISPDPAPVPKPVPSVTKTVTPTPKPSTTSSTTRSPASSSSTPGPTKVPPATSSTAAQARTVTATKTVTTTATRTVRVTATRTRTLVDERRYVVVRSGDTLSAIARGTRTTVPVLRRLNPRVVPQLLLPGTLVRVA